MSPIWMSTSNFYSTDEIDSNASPPLDAAENDATNTNLSKMRSYLKRCENAIIRINLSGKRVASSISTSTSKESNGPRTRKSTSSWYIDELRSECSDSQCEMVNSIEVESKFHNNLEQTMDLNPESQTNNMDNECETDHISKFKYMPTLQMVRPTS